MRFPKKKWVAPVYADDRDSTYDGNEALLQGQIEDVLDAYGIEWRRVPDNLWRFLKRVAPVQTIKELADRWRGKPDVLMLLPLDDKYSLACEVELKSKKGKIAPRQAEYRERMPVQYSRSPETNIAIIESAIAQAKKIKEMLYENRDTHTS